MRNCTFQTFDRPARSSYLWWQKGPCRINLPAYRLLRANYLSSQGHARNTCVHARRRVLANRMLTLHGSSGHVIALLTAETILPHTTTHLEINGQRRLHQNRADNFPAKITNMTKHLAGSGSKFTLCCDPNIRAALSRESRLTGPFSACVLEKEVSQSSLRRSLQCTTDYYERFP
jgi:hypothetical protein